MYGVTNKALLPRYLTKQGTDVDWKRAEMSWGERDAPLLALEVAHKYVDNRSMRSLIITRKMNLK